MQPAFYHRHYVLLLGGAQLATGRDAVPLRETTSAARCCGVLCNEYRVTLERCLLTVVQWEWWSEAPGDELSRVLQHYTHSLCLEVRFLFLLEEKAAAKS